MRKKTAYILLILGYVFVIFLNSDKQALLADEPIRALGALEMEISGNPIPTLNGEIYMNKPPLYNWILLGFFKITGSHTEFVVRLPALLSLLLFAYLIFYFIKIISGSVDVAFWTAFATLTGGNMLFYSSMLGHIDALFAAVVFSQMILLYIHSKQNAWWKFFIISAVLTFAGFMLKGLPAFVFQAISVLTLLLIKKQIKKLCSWELLAGAAVLIGLTASYFYFCSHYINLADYIANLWNESSKRTAVDHHISDTLTHIFWFPVKYLIETAPYSLALLFILPYLTRNRQQKEESVKSLYWLFMANIVIYWLSPDTRARYIFMLHPLLFYLTFYHLFERFRNRNKQVLRYLISLGFLLIAVRLLFDIMVIPQRSNGDSFADKARRDGEAIAALTKGQPLFMYYSNLHYNTSWYISLNRWEILKTKDEDDSFSTDEFYLSPEDLVYPEAESETYYTFVRQYRDKTFKLVKYKQLPPRLTNDGKYDIPGDPGDE